MSLVKAIREGEEKLEVMAAERYQYLQAYLGAMLQGLQG